jgi:hypothetical protein
MILEEIKLHGMGFILNLDFDRLQTEYLFFYAWSQIKSEHHIKGKFAYPTKFSLSPDSAPLFVEVAYKNLVPVNAMPGDVLDQNVSTLHGDDTRTTAEEAKNGSTSLEADKVNGCEVNDLYQRAGGVDHVENASNSINPTPVDDSLLFDSNDDVPLTSRLTSCFDNKADDSNSKVDVPLKSPFDTKADESDSKAGVADSKDDVPLTALLIPRQMILMMTK